MKLPLISIIVPTYNSETYLGKCVRSILAQSFKDFELLLIDDGSTDKSGKICDYFAKADNRIKVYHKENSGVSSARNLGLDNISGVWVTFIDSDDCIEQNYLEKLISHTESNIVDLVISGYKITAKNHRLVHDNSYHLLFLGNTSCYTVPWGKLFKTSIIIQNHIRFNEKMKLGEDMVFLYEFISQSSTACLTGNTGYNYNTNAGNSLSKRMFSYEDEIIIYKYGTSAIETLIANKHITDNLAIERLSQLKVFFIRRVLNSLYYNNVDRRIRIQTIKTINTPLYVSLTISNDWKNKIYTWLLARHLYTCYDLLRTSIISMKRTTQNNKKHDSLHNKILNQI